MSNVASLSLFRSRPRDWSNQELAEFYRVERVLIQSGMRVATDRGLSDEGDPWFVFCREDDSEPIVHFARIDGDYVVVSSAYEGVARGRDFRSLVQNIIDRQQLWPGEVKRGNSNVLMHPATLLVAVVGVAFLKAPAPAQAKEPTKDGAKKAGAAAISASADFTLPGDVVTRLEERLGVERDFNSGMRQILAATILSEGLYSDLSNSASAGEADRARRLPLADTNPGIPAPEASTEVVAPERLENAYSSSNNAHVDELAPQPQVGFETAVAAIIDLVGALHDIGSPADSSPEVPKASSDPSVLASIVPAPFFHSDPGLVFFSKAGFGGAFATFAAQAHAVQLHTADANDTRPALKVNNDKIGSTPAKAADVLESQVFHEDAYLVFRLPSEFENVVHYKNASKSGSAADFLTQNNVALTTHVEDASTLPLQSPDASPDFEPVEAAPELSDNVYVSSASAGTGDILTADTFIHALQLFLSETPSSKVIVSQRQEFVFYGPNDVMVATTPMESITLSFSDGSSISIVGQQQTLEHLLSNVQ
jgi:hypothetical protein